MRKINKFVSKYVLASVAILAANSLCSMPSYAAMQNAEVSQNNTIALPQDEITYFVLPDRFIDGDKANNQGGLKGNANITGYDIGNKGYYLGGDLKGLTQNLDYIKNMGVTAIWLAPIFKNKPVQGPEGQKSAGYHGYWITDFTSVDPHFGTNEDFRKFVNAAHAKGLKVYMDIITNHTADVIFYRECVGKTDCNYRDHADYPDKAYTPFIVRGEENIKTPKWLNDTKYYNNRGNTTFKNESSIYGDFAGLDDLDTLNPDVINGFVEIYAKWIEDFKIDGFRIDTVKHVNPEFWQSFIPAIKERAKKAGINNFHIFGEVYIDGVNPGALAVYTHRDKMPSVLDFSFQSAVRDIVGRGKPTDALVKLFDGDILYKDAEDGAMQLQTFISNHDMGRLPMQIRQDNPNIALPDLQRRIELANFMMMFMRGAPTIYSGDEQGFIGDGNDQDGREPLFKTNVPQYNDNDYIARASSKYSTGSKYLDEKHIFYQQLTEMANIRKSSLSLSRGNQKILKYSDDAGIFALSRKYNNQPAFVIALNNSNQDIEENIATNNIGNGFVKMYGTGELINEQAKSIRVKIPAYGYVLLKADK